MTILALLGVLARRVRFSPKEPPPAFGRRVIQEGLTMYIGGGLITLIVIIVILIVIF